MWKQAQRTAQLFFVLGLLGLSAVICQAQLVGSADTYDETAPNVDPHFAQKIQRAGHEEQEKFRTLISIADAVGDNVPSLAPQRQAAPSQPPPAPPQASGLSMLGLLTVAMLVVILIVRQLPAEMLSALNAQLNPWSSVKAAPQVPTLVRAEEASLAGFLSAFHSGPAQDATAGMDPAVRAERLNNFYQKSVHAISTQRQILREVERTEETGRQKMLASLRWEMHVLKSEADLPELLPVWQLAFALEGLLKQLTDNATNVTESTLRTLAGGIELLGELARPGVEPDLLIRRPLRLLAVDDEPICRKAVSLALKRALNEPDVAENGETALALADRETYDVIFLDVEMPGMDGFELCSRIHRLATNPNTPVVFVTSHTDFVARSKSTLSGGSELIGKPFLTFEITTKALTLALRGRLLARPQPQSTPQQVEASEAEKPEVEKPQEVQPSTAEVVTIADPTAVAQTVPDAAATSPAVASQPEVEQTLESQEIATEFLTRASAQVTTLRESLQQVLLTTDETLRQDLLGDVFLRIHSFTPRSNLPAFHPAIQLSKGLENLLRKLLENPDRIAEATLLTVANAVELLDDLCGLSPDTDLMTRPPIRLLVVDDDLVARRAVAMALQMAFEKPDAADCGEVALTLASERPYDVIFMDVQMPGIDGFEACAGIRQTAINRETPVVFVTGQNDFKTRARMGESGGSDFMAKPFINAEITLKALTFAFRGRLDKLLHVNITRDELPTATAIS